MERKGPSSGKRDWLLGLLLLAATFLAYRPAWTGQPLWDDDAYMAPPELRSISGLGHLWAHPSRKVQYYPLVHTAFWLQSQLWADATVGYHLVNILLHGLCALLVVRILRRLSIPGAWLAGGFFALHPVMVESVAWITELKNTLSGVLFLGAALVYVKFDRDRERKHYAFALVLFVLALLAKTSIVPLPAALLVVFWWMRGRIGWRRDVVPLLPFVAIGVAAGVATTWVERTFMGAAGADFGLGFAERCLIAGRAFWFYLYKLLWPANLVFIYPRWHVDARVPWQYLPAVAFLITLLLFWRLRNRSRTPLSVLLYFAGMLLPALGFVSLYFSRYSFVADHFQYLAAIGPMALAAALVEKGAGVLREGTRGWAARVVGGALVSVLLVLTWRQAGRYADVETLYRATLASNDECALAHNNLGLLLMNKGRDDEAMSHYQRALGIDPRFGDAHYNIGLLLAKSGRDDEALAHYLKALNLDADHAKTYNNLGALAEKKGRPEEAVLHYQKALQIDPNQAQAHNNLGVLLARMGQADEAEAHLLKALQVNPGYADAEFNLGMLAAGMRRESDAITHYQKALHLNPRHAKSHNGLGILLARSGRIDEAVAHFRKAVGIDPTYGDAHHNLGFLLADAGRGDEAISHLRKAAEINPDAIGKLSDRAHALAEQGQLAEAGSVLQRALLLARASGDEVRILAITQALDQLGRKSVPPRDGPGAAAP